MKNVKRLFENLGEIKGVSFIRLMNYESVSTGEVANHTINVGLSVMNAKEKDLESLKNCSEETLISLSESKKIALDIFKTALSEMTASAEKNMSADIKDRTAQSQGQTNAYIDTNVAGVKVLKDTLEVHVFGQAINKEVLKEGVYKTVNSSAKTLAKKAITKELNLRAGKFRTYKFANLQAVKLNGECIELS